MQIMWFSLLKSNNYLEDEVEVHKKDDADDENEIDEGFDESTEQNQEDDDEDGDEVKWISPIVLTPISQIITIFFVCECAFVLFKYSNVEDNGANYRASPLCCLVIWSFWFAC